MLAVLWVAGRLGAHARKLLPRLESGDEDDFGLILGATLTLLGLIVGFTFSMAVNRYDQRKNYEEQEANAIDTEYLRLDGLPAANAAEARALMREYVDQRIVYYASSHEDLLRQARAKTSRLQSKLWSIVTTSTTSQPNSMSTLVMSGMNDVFTSRGYTEAAWHNRVPLTAWILMISIAIFCNLLFGYRAHGRTFVLFLILPIVLSISFFLIADIDSPRTGVIRVRAQNLENLADSLRL